MNTVVQAGVIHKIPRHIKVITLHLGGYFVLGIDCDASNCCISCERRHLESRDLWHGPLVLLEN